MARGLFMFVLVVAALTVQLAAAQTGGGSSDPGCPTVAPVTFTATGDSSGYGNLIDHFTKAVNSCNVDMAPKLVNAVQQCAASCQVPASSGYLCVPQTTASVANCYSASMAQSCSLLQNLEWSCTVNQPVTVGCACKKVSLQRGGG